MKKLFVTVSLIVLISQAGNAKDLFDFKKPISHAQVQAFLQAFVFYGVPLAGFQRFLVQVPSAQSEDWEARGYYFYEVDNTLCLQDLFKDQERYARSSIELFKHLPEDNGFFRCGEFMDQLAHARFMREIYPDLIAVEKYGTYGEMMVLTAFYNGIKLPKFSVADLHNSRIIIRNFLRRLDALFYDGPARKPDHKEKFQIAGQVEETTLSMHLYSVFTDESFETEEKGVIVRGLDVDRPTRPVFFAFDDQTHMWQVDDSVYQTGNMQFLILDEPNNQETYGPIVPPGFLHLLNNNL